MRNCLAVLLLLFSIPSIADWKDDLQNTARLQIGNFCLDQIPKGVIRVGNQVTQIDGAAWYEFNFYVAEGFAGKASWVLADVSDALVPLPKKCLGLAKNQILTGIIQRMTLNGYVKFDSGASAVEIFVPEGQLSGQLSNVTSTTTRLYGATVDLQGPLLEIRNKTDVRINRLKFDGNLELVSSGRTLTGVKLQLSGYELPGSFDLRQPIGAKAVFQLSMPSATLSLWAGAFRKGVTAIAMPSWRVAGITLDQTKATVTEMRMVAQDGTVTLEFNKTVLDGSSGTYPYRPSFQLAATHASIRSLTAPVPPNTHKAVVGDWAVRDAQLTSKNLAFVGNGPDTFQGAARLDVSEFEPKTQQVTGAVLITNPKSSPLRFVFPQGLLQAEFRFDGIQGNIKARMESGSAGILDLGGILTNLGSTSRVLAKHVDLDSSAAEWRFPFKLDAGKLKGRLAYQDSSNEVTVEGVLDAAKLAGELVVTLPDLAASRISIPVNEFQLAVSATLTHRALAHGQRLQFGSIGFTAINIEPLTITASAASGRLSMTAKKVLVLNPKFRMGVGQLAYTMNGHWESEASVEVHYYLSSRSGAITSGQFLAKNLAAEPDQSGWVNLDDFYVLTPRFSLQELRAKFDNGAGIVVIRELQLGAAEVRQGALDDRSKPFFAARVSHPLTLGKVDATISGEASGYKFDVVGIQGLSFVAGSVDYIGMDGFKYSTPSGASFGPISMTHEQWSGKIEFRPGKLELASSASGGADVEQFWIELSGPKHNPGGTGFIRFGKIDATFNSPMKLDTCDVSAPAQAHVIATGGEGPFQIISGGAKGTITIGTAYIDYHTTDSAECTRPALQKVIQERRCCCRWRIEIPFDGEASGETCTPEISIDIEWKEKLIFAAAAIVSNGATVDLGLGSASGHKRICLGSFVNVTPVNPNVSYVTLRVNTSVPLIGDLISYWIEYLIAPYMIATKTTLTTSVFYTNSLLSVMFPLTACF